VVRTFNAELNSPDDEAPQVAVIPPPIAFDTTHEFCHCRHMQLARAVATLVPGHQATGNKTAALLTALAAHLSRLEYAGSSVMNAVCCAAISSRGMSRTRNRIVHAIPKVISEQ
jgi:hypothetical protein